MGIYALPCDEIDGLLVQEYISCVSRIFELIGKNVIKNVKLDKIINSLFQKLMSVFWVNR